MIITRYHNNNTTVLQLTVEFLTPTFLGGADQNAELRAGPFKNLLRQWWRVATGSRFNNHADMLKEEGELFGSVLEDKQATASKVRITLTCENGNFEVVDFNINIGKTYHKNVEDRKTGKKGMEVSNALYLGFGPLSNPPKKYIRPGSNAHLTLTLPKAYNDEMINVLQMMDTFGAIGSRSRNGWGSLFLSSNSFPNKQPSDFSETLPISTLIGQHGAKEYPSKLGTDDKGRLLCWETLLDDREEYDWKTVMMILAKHYLELRTALHLKDKDRVNERHILGYPVTHHALTKWGGNTGRMPSQLRLMVKKNQEGRLVGRILHLPHKLPKDKPWSCDFDQQTVWGKIHAILDANKQFHRCGRAK